MKTTMLIPWNWFRKEEQYGTDMPVHRVRAQQHRMPAAPLHRELDRLFDSLLGTRGFFERTGDYRTEPAMLRPSLDISGDEKNYFVTVELPGVEEKNLRVELDNDVLRIFGEKKHETEEKEENGDSGKSFYRIERSYGSFQRMLTLPGDADAANITAAHKEGVLTVTIPRKEADKPENRFIAIGKE